MPHADAEAFHAVVRYPKWFYKKTRREDLGMEHSDCIGQGRKGKHLAKDERVVIEVMRRLVVVISQLVDLFISSIQVSDVFGETEAG